MSVAEQNQTPQQDSLSAKEVYQLSLRFDRAADAEAAAPPPATVEESADRLRALIDHLPQRMVIRQDHIDRWVQRTLEMAVSRMELEHGEDNYSLADVHNHVLWHVRRSSAFGGSDTGTIVKHYRGERGTFGDAKNLVLEKLLILAPQPSTPEMARGVRAEPWLQRMYLEENGAKTDLEALNALKGYRWEKRPSAIGTPDDVVLLNGKRKIIDYKAPSADVIAGYMSEGISFDYQCQVHHYATLAMARGIKFDEMSLEVFDVRSFKIVSFPVEFDVALATEISKACAKLWLENVMTGNAPLPVRPEELEVKDQRIVDLGIEATLYKLLGEQVKKRQEEALGRIANTAAEWHDLAEGTLDLKVAKFARRRTWNEEQLVNLAEASGVDIKPFRDLDKKGAIDEAEAAKVLRQIFEAIENPEELGQLIEQLREAGLPVKSKLNLDGLAGYLEGQEISVIPAMDLATSFKLSAKKKGPEFDRLTASRDRVDLLVERLEEAVIEFGPELLGQLIDDGLVEQIETEAEMLEMEM